MTSKKSTKPVRKATATALVHPPSIKIPSDNHPVVEPIHISTKYTFESYEALENLIAGKRTGFLYSRVMNPTVRSLEKTLANLQGCEDGLCSASGIASISTLFFTLLQQGDHVVYFIESYKPTRYLIEKFLKKWGINSTIVSIRDHTGIIKALKKEDTKLVIFESPTNPLLHIADIKTITNEAKKAGVLSVLDNTFSGFHNHKDLGVDIFIHSLTKFAGGHSDTMGGVILSTQKIIDKIRWPASEIGACLDPVTAYNIQKGLKTYPLRYEKSCQNAMIVAQFLEAHSHIDMIKYPGLESHPQKKLIDQQQLDYGSVVSFNLKQEIPIRHFINRLQLFKVSPSLGCVESLAAPIDLFYGGLLSEENKKISGITSQSVRLSVGIEDAKDLIDDLNHALAL